MQGPRNMDREQRAPVPLQHHKSTKQLINRFEALNNQIPNPRIIGRAGSPRLASGSSKTGMISRKQKPDKSPIRESLRNLFSTFKKGKPLLKSKPQGSRDTGLLGVPGSIKEQSTLPQFSGPLWYLPSEPSPVDATPRAWVSCMVTLEGGRLSLSTLTESIGAIPMLHVISLSYCTDVRSLAPDMDGEENRALPTHDDGEGSKLFEILFEGRARETFAAPSNHKRADWISAIWDAILPSQNLRCPGDPRGSRSSGAFLDCKTPVISERDTTHHGEASLRSERDLPPIPPHGITSEPNFRLGVLATPVLATPPVSPGIHLSRPVSRGSCYTQPSSTTSEATPNQPSVAQCLPQTGNSTLSPILPSGNFYIDPERISKILAGVATRNNSMRSTCVESLIDSYGGDSSLHDGRPVLNPNLEDPQATSVTNKHGQRIRSGGRPQAPTSKLSDPSPKAVLPLCDRGMSDLGQQLTQVLEHGLRRLPQEIATMIHGSDGPPALPQILCMLSGVCKWTAEMDRTITAIQARLTTIEVSGRRHMSSNNERPLCGGDTDKIVAALAAINSKLDGLLALHDGNDTGNCGVGCSLQLKELTGILKEESQQRILQTQQQTDSVRYLNELNAWLESFVNNGTSQIQTLSVGIEELRREMGCSNGLPNGGEGTLAEIYKRISQPIQGQQSLGTLQQSIDRLLGFLNTETRTSLTADQVAGMFRHQQQEYEALLRILTTELSNEIKGERLRFVEAMQTATAINVQKHVEQFREELSQEVLGMTQEVGRLHQERQTAENQIADLFAFYAKQKPAGAILNPNPVQQLAQGPSQVFEAYTARYRPSPEPSYR